MIELACVFEWIDKCRNQRQLRAAITGCAAVGQLGEFTALPIAN